MIPIYHTALHDIPAVIVATKRRTSHRISDMNVILSHAKGVHHVKCKSIMVSVALIIKVEGDLTSDILHYEEASLLYHCCNVTYHHQLQFPFVVLSITSPCTSWTE